MNPATHSPGASRGSEAHRIPPSTLSARRVGGPARWWDWVLEWDPGLEQIQAGWRTLVSLVVGLAVGYTSSNGLGVPAQLGLMVGGVLGMTTSLLIAENSVPKLARAVLWVPFPFAGGLVLSEYLHSRHGLELWLVGATMTSVLLLARFGTLGLVTGIMLFASSLIGVIIPFSLAVCGRLSLVAVATVTAMLIARLLVCYPTPREDLLRAQRAFVVQARHVTDAAARALAADVDPTVAIRQMNRKLHRLSITALVIDGRLARPETAADPRSAELLHQHLFDSEVALHGIGRAVSALAGRKLSAPLRETVILGLSTARDAHVGRAHVLPMVAELIRSQADAQQYADGAQAQADARRLGDLLGKLADSLGYWFDLGQRTSLRRALVPFQPAVALEAGGKPFGAGPVARKAASESHGRSWRAVVPTPLRAPLQLAVAAVITLPLANAFNRAHFYWGPIGVLVVLMGTSTTTERVRKVAHRAVGTAVGGAIGILLVHILGTGHVLVTMVIVVGSLSIGSWAQQRGYVFFVGFLVLGLVELYALSTPVSGLGRLVTQRLVDNVGGMAVGALCAAILFPVSNRRIRREAERAHLSALENLTALLALRLENPQEQVRLRGAARSVTAALYQVRSVFRPLIRMPISMRQSEHEFVIALLETATRHAQALASEADSGVFVPPHLRGRVQGMIERTTASLRVLGQRVINDHESGVWISVGPAIRNVVATEEAGASRHPAVLDAALEELAFLDDTLTELASVHGFATEDLCPAAFFGSNPSAGRARVGHLAAHGRHRKAGRRRR